jgi:hypothetical protein
VRHQSEPEPLSKRRQVLLAAMPQNFETRALQKRGDVIREIIVNKIIKAGFSVGWVSALDAYGRTVC